VEFSRPATAPDSGTVPLLLKGPRSAEGRNVSRLRIRLSVVLAAIAPGVVDV
jgi:hypothetical protein